MTRLGIAGLGNIGRVHYEASRKVKDAQVVAVATSRPTEARSFLTPEVRIVTDYRSLLKLPNLDAVIISVPTFLHEPYVVEAAESGRHILCEKPFALHQATAQRMLDAAERSGVTLMVGQVLRFWPHYSRIKEMVGAGAVGTIRTVRAYRLASYPKPGGWFIDPQKSGGCLLDLQIHDVDFICWLLGFPERLQTVGLKSATGGWDHVLTTLYYPAAVASLEGSFFMPQGYPFTCGIRVVGDAGCLEYGFRVAGNVAEREHATGSLRFYTPNGLAKTLPVSDEDMYAVQLRYFVSCVESGRKPDLCPPQESCEVMGIMDRCLQSAESSQALAPEIARRTL